MKIRLIFERKGYDDVAIFADQRTVVVEIPDDLNGYYLSDTENIKEEK